MAVGRSKVRLYVDCRKVAERPIGEAGSPPGTGFVTLGRLAKARGPRSSSAAVSLGWAPPGGGGRARPPRPLQATRGRPCSLHALQLQLQLLQVVCSDTWAEEDRCCELPALVGGSVPTQGHAACGRRPFQVVKLGDQGRLPGGGGLWEHLRGLGDKAGWGGWEDPSHREAVAEHSGAMSPRRLGRAGACACPHPPLASWGGCGGSQDQGVRGHPELRGQTRAQGGPA